MMVVAWFQINIRTHLIYAWDNQRCAGQGGLQRRLNSTLASSASTSNLNPPRPTSHPTKILVLNLASTATNVLPRCLGMMHNS
jgi:hypothetical protein